MVAIVGLFRVGIGFVGSGLALRRWTGFEAARHRRRRLLLRPAAIYTVYGLFVVSEIANTAYNHGVWAGLIGGGGAAVILWGGSDIEVRRGPRVFGSALEASGDFDDGDVIYPRDQINASVVFDVPRGVQPTLIVLHDSDLSNGVPVNLTATAACAIG